MGPSAGMPLATNFFYLFFLLDLVVYNYEQIKF
jgi:hypothetical protein